MAPSGSGGLPPKSRRGTIPRRDPAKALGSELGTWVMGSPDTLSSARPARDLIRLAVASLISLASTVASAASDEGPEPPKLGPVSLKTGSGTIDLGVSLQLRADVRSIEGDDGRSGEVAISINRLRMSASGNFLDERVTFEVQLNTTPESFELVDVWIGFVFAPSLRLRLGQMKVPYTWYRQLSFTRLAFVDWSPTTAWFGSERQLGAMLHDDPAKSGWSYRLGVFTGENRRSSHAFRLAEIYGEPLENASGADGFAVADDVDPELVGTLRWTSDGFDAEQQVDWDGGPARFLLAASGAVNFDSDETEDFAGRASIDAWLKLRHFSMVATGYLALSKEVLDDDLIVAATGLNLEAAYLIDRKVELAARFALIDPTDALTDDARTRAERIIEGAVSEDEEERLRGRYGDAGTLLEEHELRLGVSYFLVGHSLRVQLDGGWIHRELRAGPRDDFEARTIVQLAF